MSLMLCSALLGALTGCGSAETTSPPPLLQRPPAPMASARPARPQPRPGHAATTTPTEGAVWPLSPAPEVVRPFEPPPEPWAAGHRGADLRGTPGQAVRAAHAGQVVFSGVIAGRGVVSVEHHDGWRTTYEPLTDRLAVGARVAPGATIGVLAGDGSHCPPAACLHWGLIVAPDDYRDPLTLVGGRRAIVLLPLE